jgi:hypothetical protein
VIVKEGTKFVVRSEDGKSLGTYATRAEAEKRLAQIEMHKAMDDRMRGR